jgi:zinc protease
MLSYIRLVAFAFLVANPIQANAADDPALKAASALYENIRTETLPNGLRVFLKPVPGAPVVTTMVAYKVGSADENLDATGLSHYLEHLMFKGTEKLMPGDIDRMTMRSGGRNNADTSEDMTVYHFDFAADQWDTALRIEADRMRNLRIDERHEFEQEKGAVISELNMDEDRPFDLELKAIAPLLFGKTAPYGHPVIGETQHVRGATAGVIKAHYDRWYYPNNAALVVVGGFDADKASARIRELFASIPAGKLPPRKEAPPVSRDKPVRINMPSKFEVPRMVMGFNGVRSNEPDAYALEMIQTLLSGGKTSRLYRKLVEQEAIASEVSASDNAGRYPGWFAVDVELLKGKSPQKAEELVLAELARLANEPVGPEELQRARRIMTAGQIFAHEGVHGLADSIARGVTTNDLEYLRTYLPRVVAVTPAQIQEAARKYLDANKRVVVWSLPKEGKEAGGGEAQTPPSRKRQRRLPGNSPVAHASGSDKTSTFDLERTRRVVLPNGLTLLLFEDHRLPIVAARAFVRNARLLEPADKAGVASLVGSLLDEGTKSRGGQQIAAAIEDVGGALRMSQAGGSVQVLTPDRSLGLDLLFDCMLHPSFPADALERKRAQTLSELDDNERRADVRGRQALARLIYGPNHPLSRPSLGLRPIVEKLSAEDCRTFHARLFVPNNTMVAVVGDFVASDVIAEITRLTRDWKPWAGALQAALPPLTPLPQFTQKIISMPESAQLYVYLGHAGIMRMDPDYFRLLVMDYVLGTGTGFTDRLSANLRDRQGLAYSVSATITGNAAEVVGTFAGSIGTFPDKFEAVKSGFLKEINRIRDEAPTAEEVQDAKTYLLGSLPFHYTSNAGIAEQLLQIERFGLGFDYLSNFRKEVAAVTAADVQEVARKHLHPDRLALVASGPVDEHGRPLTKK